ncbi:uncharacterized protein V1518DRAFT_206071 [Limtongia smithiae]|uniref:uncharacterized protein n=1 Tax=Limtongia smithiae TaxID=1125753 RepID=UPI0034CE94E9
MSYYESPQPQRQTNLGFGDDDTNLFKDTPYLTVNNSRNGNNSREQQKLATAGHYSGQYYSSNSPHYDASISNTLNQDFSSLYVSDIRRPSSQNSSYSRSSQALTPPVFQFEGQHNRESPTTTPITQLSLNNDTTLPVQALQTEEPNMFQNLYYEDNLSPEQLAPSTNSDFRPEDGFPDVTNPSPKLPVSYPTLIRRLRKMQNNLHTPSERLDWALEVLHLSESSAYLFAKDDSSIVSLAETTIAELTDEDLPKLKYNVGLWRYQGRFGIEKDLKRAKRYFKSAANHGYARANYYIGIMYEADARYSDAMYMFLRGQESNDCASCYALGCIYMRGADHQAVDPEKALYYLGRAAENVDPDFPMPAFVYGQLLAGELPDWASKLPTIHIDIPQAKYYIELAAQFGWSPAQVRMGVAYQKENLDCEYNAAVSLHYFAVASRTRNLDAYMGLSSWFLAGDDDILPKNEPLAFDYAKAAADLGNARGYFALGYFYEVGITVQKDDNIAQMWYRKAAERGNQNAIERLNDSSRPFSRDDHTRLVNGVVETQRRMTIRRTNKQATEQTAVAAVAAVNTSSSTNSSEHSAQSSLYGGAAESYRPTTASSQSSEEFYDPVADTSEVASNSYNYSYQKPPQISYQGYPQDARTVSMPMQFRETNERPVSDYTSIPNTIGVNIPYATTDEANAASVGYRRPSPQRRISSSPQLQVSLSRAGQSPYYPTQQSPRHMQSDIDCLYVPRQSSPSRSIGQSAMFPTVADTYRSQSFVQEQNSTTNPPTVDTQQYGTAQDQEINRTSRSPLQLDSRSSTSSISVSSLRRKSRVSSYAPPQSDRSSTASRKSLPATSMQNELDTQVRSVSAAPPPKSAKLAPTTFEEMGVPMAKPEKDCAIM